MVALDALSEDAENLVQETRQRAQWSAAIEQVGHGAQQVAKQFAGTLLSRDIEMDLICGYHQAKQVEVDWPQCEIENRAGATSRRDHGRKGVQHSACRIKQLAHDRQRS